MLTKIDVIALRLIIMYTYNKGVNVMNYDISQFKKPSFSSIEFAIEKSGNLEVLDKVFVVEKGESVIVTLKATILGVDYLKKDDLDPQLEIYFCVYENNLSGKGYRIISNMILPITNEDRESPEIKIHSPILLLDDDSKPTQGSFEGTQFSKQYNYYDTYLALRIFYSRGKLLDFEDLDTHFNSLTNIIYDSKLPIRQGEE